MSIHQPAIELIREARDASQKNADRMTENVQRRMEQIAKSPADDFTPSDLNFLRRVVEEAEARRDMAIDRTTSLTATLTHLRAKAAGAGTRA